MNIKFLLALAATLFVMAGGAYSPAVAQSSDSSTEVSDDASSDKTTLITADDSDDNDSNDDHDDDHDGGDGGDGGKDD